MIFRFLVLLINKNKNRDIKPKTVNPINNGNAVVSTKLPM